MTERDATTHRDQIGLLGRRGCLDRNAKGAGGAPEQHWIAERLGRADQQQSLSLLGELCHLAAKTRLDPARKCCPVGDGETARETRPRERMRQLEQGQRVAICLRDDPVTHPLVERPDARRVEELARVSVGECAQE
jgi:hypothetical protein